MLFHVIVVNVIDSPFQLFNKCVLLKEEEENTCDEHVTCRNITLTFLISDFDDIDNVVHLNVLSLAGKFYTNNA